MCLIIFSWKKNKEFPLILMANRDEFYERPTEQAHVWDNNLGIIAGKDLLGNGTWMGLSKTGRWAALTNYRALSEMRKDAPTRGALVKNFLTSDVSINEYLSAVKSDKNNYNGFNLLVGTPELIGYYSNMERVIKNVKSGVHGLSNHLLNSPWPKVEAGKAKLTRSVSQKFEIDDLFNHMNDKTFAPDSKLPNTGVSKEWERMLSPMFIEGKKYGTRCSTVLVMDKLGKFTFIEKSYPNSFNDFENSIRKFEVEPTLST